MLAGRVHRLLRSWRRPRSFDSGIELVFWGADEGEIKRADDVKFKQNFARSMSLAEAMDPKNILCYEMNGVPLPPDNGFPLRLIAPGWYGIANAKWLKRIEVRDQRFENQFRPSEREVAAGSR